MYHRYCSISLRNRTDVGIGPYIICFSISIITFYKFKPAGLPKLFIIHYSSVIIHSIICRANSPTNYCLFTQPFKRFSSRNGMFAVEDVNMQFVFCVHKGIDFSDFFMRCAACIYGEKLVFCTRFNKKFFRC